jgi:CBS-domain-containing membrane protein
MTEDNKTSVLKIFRTAKTDIRDDAKPGTVFKEKNSLYVMCSDCRLEIMFRNELYTRFTVKDIMTPAQATLVREDKMIDVMHKFEKTNCNYLPVVNVNGQLEGYVSRTRMYSMYRHMVADFSAE